jgi:probable F420-dependent oxidoreductase
MPSLPRYSISLPKAVDAPLAEYARLAEQMGFWGAWTVDHAVGEEHAEDPTLDALHTMTHVAAVTTTLRVGVAVLVLPRRNPAQVARDIGTMDVLSRGRVTLAVGMGGVDPAAAAFGFRTGMRARQMVEAIGVLRALWGQQPATYRGDLFSFDGAYLQPRPVQKPHPPIWIGARADVALRRAAKIGDGWIGAGSSSIEDFRRQTQVLKEALEGEGRRIDEFPMSKRVYVAVEGDSRLALERLAPALDHVYRSPGMAKRTAVFGSPAQCADRLHELSEMGTHEIILNPLYDEFSQIERLARVVEQLRH